MQTAVTNGQVADRLGLLAEVGLGDVRAHVAQHINDARAGRVDADVLDGQLAARHDSARNEEVRRRRDVGRNGDIDRVQVLGRIEGDNVAVRFDFNAQCAEHTLGVVAGGSRLDDGRLALGVQTREKNCALELRGRHRQTVLDAMQLARVHGQRAEVVVLALDGGAHFAQRLHHAAHRSALDGSVAVHRRGERLAGENAAQQPGRRARVAGIQLALRRGQTMQTDALDNDFLVGNVDGNAHFAEAVDGGQAVLAHQKAGDVGGAVCQCAQHDGAVRDGFVARYGDLTVQRTAGLDLHGSILLLVG